MTPTTFVHIGDFHARPDARNADRYKALDQIIAEGERLPDLGAWLWPGDLNHAKMAIADKNALRERVQRMARRAPVVICYGNHDEAGDLDFLAHLEADHRIVVASEIGCIGLKLAAGQPATIFVVPYPNKAKLVAAGVAKADVVATGADLLEPYFMLAADQLTQARGRGDLTLMIGHINVAGSKTSVGQPNIGHEIELSPRHLDRLGNIPKLLNHIHYGQTIAGAHYAGSVSRQNWGEIEDKTYIVVTTPNRCSDATHSWYLTRYPIDVPPMWHVEGELTRECFTWNAKAGEGGQVLTPPASWKGQEVRVRYRYKASERSVLLEAPILAEFADALRLKIESVAVPDRDVRAPEVAAARTLGEKVAAYLKAERLSTTFESKIAALEYGDAAQVLADVDAFLAAVDAETEATVAA